ncbi:leucine-rich repeat domain-containing protein [Natranaerobius trueperi]|uniref:Bacterial repeat domain-containing protein n=1 Tax=Natranaerobius trueperi TaxID=759412 RepID=A0A226BUL0_9FIRM|nr:leucine-rich repeat domain-containing protein [Natranaerobius trueperi]OWZ82718.1 hypothetical protein CDO51_12565 [Natranaerobius trueperi]
MSGKRLIYLLLIICLSVSVAFMIGCAPEEKVEDEQGIGDDLNEYKVEVQADLEDAGEIIGEGTYERGEDVNLKVEPKEGFEFVSWEKNGDEIKEKSFEFKIEEDTEVVANFREILVPDDNLKEGIRDELGIEGKLTKEDLKDLKTLRARNENITSLEGLQYAKNLETLYISANEVSDLTPLKELEELKELNIRNNEVTDISPLKGKDKLKELDVVYNNISNYSPLISMNELKLTISFEQLPDDLSVFNKINKLVTFVDDPEDIYSLKPLDDIELGITLRGGRDDEELNDISPLAEINNIVELRIYLNMMGTSDSIEDFTPISKLEDLKELKIAGYKIEDIDFLSNLENLQNLQLIKTDTKNIEALADLENLEELQLYKNEISDLSPLKDLNNLKILRAEHIPASDVSPLSSLDNLEELNLRQTKVQDVSPLKDLTQLKILNLDMFAEPAPSRLPDGYTVGDISPLLSMENLENLYLRNKLEENSGAKKIIKELEGRNVDVEYSYYEQPGHFKEMENQDQ